MYFAGDGQHAVIRHFPPVEPAGIRRRKHHQEHRPRVRQIAGQTNEVRHTLFSEKLAAEEGLSPSRPDASGQPGCVGRVLYIPPLGIAKSAAVEGGRRLTRPQQVISGITPDPNPISNGVRHKKSTAPRGTHCARSHGRAAYANRPPSRMELNHEQNHSPAQSEANELKKTSEMAKNTPHI